MAEKVGELYYEVTLETRKMLDGEREAKRSLGRIGTEADKLQATVTKVAAAVGAALAAIAVEGLISKLVSTQRQFDVMFASLKTMTGGTEQAGAAFERLREFAAKTPFTLEQSVKGFVKLKALGLDPSERAMTSFGNTASAMGKSLEQMIEAVADASTSEFERLKEFGIKASVEGDKVKLTFKGVTTQVQNNAASITEYLVKIGETNFAGAMSERMKTLDGDISNLQDSLAALYLTISQSGAGDAIAKGVRMATQAIQELSTSVKEGGLTEYFDALRPVISGVGVVAVSLAGIIAGRLAQSFVIAAQAMVAKTAAAKAAAEAQIVQLRNAAAVAASNAEEALSSQAVAIANAEKAITAEAAARANVALLVSQQQQAALNAKMVAGTEAYFQAMAVERTVTAQLTAAKVAEAEATAAVTTATRALTVARGQAAAAAGAQAAATATLSTAQAAQVAAASIATKIASGFSAVLAALGGPIGVAVIGLGLLAMNWDKITGSARDAAKMSEEAAERIASALRKSAGRATTDLQKQLSEVRDELSGIDAELERSADPKRAGRADEKQISELRQRRATLVGIAGDIQRAMDSLHGGQGRGRIVPELVDPNKPAAPPPPPKKDKFDEIGYLAQLAMANADAMQRIDIQEREQLRRNEDLRKKGDLTATQAAQGRAEIERHAAQERLDIAAKFELDRLALQDRIEEEHNQRNERAAKDAEEARARGRELALSSIGGADPVVAIELEAQAKTDALKLAAQGDLENAELYAAAMVAVETEKARKIGEIQQRQIDQQNANNAQSLAMLGQFTGDVFSLLQQAGRDRTALAKAAFLASKAIAVAEIILNTEVAASKAVGQLGIFGLPLAATIRATGYASAGMVGGQALAQTFGGGRQYGGPATAGTMYRVNETGRPEMFTAANGSQYMLPTRSGNVTPADQVGGSGAVLELRVINQAPGVQVTQRRGADGQPELVIAEVAAQISERRGPVGAAMRNVYGRGSL